MTTGCAGIVWVEETADPFWARVSLWLAGAGLATGLLAAIFGLIDFATLRRARQHLAGWVHAIGNVAAMLATAINLGLRLGDSTVVPPGGLILSALTALILLITGWYGGETVLPPPDRRDRA